MRTVLGVLMMAAGLWHFVKTDFYVRIVPSYLPAPLALVWISGAASVLLGAMFFWERTAVLAAWGTVLFLIAVFPANVHLALHPEIFPGFPVWILWARLPLQAALILWALRATRA